MVHDGVLGVDVGGTHIRAAAITLEGKVIARRQTACRAVEGFEAVVARLAATVAEAAEAGGLPPDAPVGVALPGPVNPHTRSEEHSLNSSHMSISYAVFCLKKKK